ncbi:response regulator transcription factor [Chloroflexota bacterium]
MSRLVDSTNSDRTQILLVDANADFLHVATGFLQRYGDLHVVGAVGGAEEALAQAQDLQPHVVLLDLDMPNLTGLRTIPRLRELLPRVGIITLALSNGSAYREAALAAGADDFVSKTALVTELLPAIRRTVHSY